MEWGVLKELGCGHEEQLLKIICSILHLNSDNRYRVLLRKASEPMNHTTE